MEKVKCTVGQLFGKIPACDKPDVVQNIYAFRFVIFCMAIYSVENIMNIFNIFIVDKKIFSTGYFFACIFAIIYFVLIIGFGVEHPVTKYISVVAIMCIINSASISLTYHMVIILMIPIVIAGMYTSKTIFRYTFVLTIISIILSTYLGYFVGVCDANMALLTSTSINNLVEDGKFLMNQVNPNPMLTVGLFFAMPRCIMAVAFAYVSNSVNNVIRKSQKKAWEMQMKACMDEMTGLYNKNKLRDIIEDKTYDYQKIAVIFWDLNGLKNTNDNYGHQAGDNLIIKVAESIRRIAGNEDIALRNGGDEFILIIPKGTAEKAQKTIDRWKKELKKISEGCDFPVTASVGYAVGEKETLEDVIAAADEKMYQCKQKVYEGEKMHC